MNRAIIPIVLVALVSTGLADPPAYRLRDRQMEYHGPGRQHDAADPTAAIPIAWFGPSDPKHPEGGDLWIAAQLAAEQANTQKDDPSQTFRLLPVWSETPWDEGARRLTELVYKMHAVAIVGGIDGASTHVAEQIAAKARLPVVSPVATDKSINLAGVPWIFSCPPGDHLLAPVLADSLADGKNSQRIVLLASTNHDSHLFTVELLASLAKREVGLTRHHDFDPKTAKLGNLARQAIQAAPNAIVVVADSRISAQLVVAIRDAGFDGHLAAGPAAARRPFVATAKGAADGVVVPMPSSPTGSQSEQFQQFATRFRERTGHTPDFAAAQTYDAVRMLVEAIHQAGPNRSRIADALRDLTPYEGAAGIIHWDKVGANTRKIHLGVYRNGRLVAAE